MGREHSARSAPRAGREPAPSAAQPAKDARAIVGRVLVLADAAKPAVRALLAELVPWLGSRVRHVDVVEDPRRFQAPGDGSAPGLLVVLGGDGAILAAVRAFRDAPVPTLGINLGRVGFLASTPAGRWRETLAGVLAGEGVLERRTRLAVRAELGGGGPARTAVALNDVVVQRSTLQGMLALSLHVGATFVTEYRADGLIVATPSGSTAYALSSGGPILEPAVPGFVIVPICPQGLSNRPLVLLQSHAVSIGLARTGGVASLVVDGQELAQLGHGARVDVETHAVPYPLYAMPGLDPFRRLRERLGWSGSLSTPAQSDA
jgi:NAD+ kinase